MGPEIIICISEAKEHFAMITKDVKPRTYKGVALYHL
jgi:hypothetical protein